MELTENIVIGFKNLSHQLTLRLFACIVNDMSFEGLNDIETIARVKEIFHGQSEVAAADNDICEKNTFLWGIDLLCGDDVVVAAKSALREVEKVFDNKVMDFDYSWQDQYACSRMISTLQEVIESAA